MMSRRDVEAKGIFIVNLHAVDAYIDPAAFFRFTGDDAVRGADIAPAIQLMPVWRRKDGHVDVVAALDVFQNRPAGNDTRRDRFDALQQLFPARDELDGFGIGRHAYC